MKLEIVLLVFGALLMMGALVAGLARRSFLSLTAVFVLVGFALGHGGAGRARVRRDVGLRARPRDGRTDRDPVPRRPRGRGGDAPDGLAPAAPQARARHADHGALVALRAHGARRPRLDSRPSSSGALLVADGPGALLLRRHESARAAPRAPLAQPRVRAERRPRAPGGAGLHRGARRRGRLRLVAVRPAGRHARARVRRLLAWAASKLLPRGARADRQDPGPCAVPLRARRRVRDLRDRGRAAAGGQRLHRGVRRRDHARDPAPRPAHELRAIAPTTSWRSSSSASSSCSARC